MRKIIIFFIILTIIGTVSLVAINLRKDSSHTDDTSEAEISQPIDLSGLDSYQPAGSMATVTDAGAVDASASQSFTISMNFVGDIMLAGNDTATSSIDAMANSQPSTYFFENVRDYFLNDDITIANCENVFSDNDNLVKTDKGEAAALEQYNNAVAEYNSAVALAQQSGTTVSMEKPEYTFRAFWFRSHAATAKLLPENGVDVVSIDNNHTYDFGTDGNMDTRAALLSYIDEKKEMLEKDLSGVDAKSVYLAGNSSLLSTAGPAMYQSGLIELASGKNAASEITDTYWAEISYEQLLAWDPSYIILASDAEYTPEDVLNDENLKECTAVKNGHVYAIPGDIEALDSPVPGGILASIWLAGILHPDQVSADMYTEEKAAFYETFYGIK